MGDYGQYIVPTADQMINFKVGQPAPSMLPLKLIRESAASKFAEQDPMFLQYGHIKGYPKFRQTLATFLTKGYKAPVDPEQLFITNGVTGGLSLLCSIYLKSGDLVFLEEPSYFLALSIMKDFKMNIRQIEMEEDGINVNKLEELLKSGVVPKALYTIPTCHNPTGRTMSVAKRARLVELSHEYGFMIIADEVYQLLSFPHITPPPPMFTFDKYGTVFALGSFSKILAPALRLGWIQASTKLLQPLVASGQLDSSGGINPVIQGIVHAAITSGAQQQHLDWTTATLWSRAHTLMDALQAKLPAGTTFERPDGGYFILVKLPKGLLAAELLPIAEKHKVLFLPGSSFGASMTNFLRLSFSWYTAEEMSIGAERLAAAIVEYQALKKNAPVQTTTNAAKAKVQLALHGANGRLGSLIASELQKDSSFESTVVDIRKSKILPASAQVIIDVTLPQGTEALVNALLTGKTSPALVIGTTGALPMDLLRKYAERAPVVIKSNFSVGVPLVCELAASAAHALPKNGEWNTQVLEVHHTKKLDAPSGTGKTITKAIQSTGVFSNVSCESLRLGDEIGTHTVYFAGPGERIEIKHVATRREVFALGALRTAAWAATQAPGLYF
ncbi:aminotransferase [Thraustotheca clavata]|uniref:Aminotransferase n=1 Tax=Thraustotheca clavata TaxID=74557 RepID=A0A1V9YYI0_9STRA|nr:aminotransferase [Thraustotheca clavata]